MKEDTRIAEFLSGAPHAVVGASSDRAKYGNKVLRAYLQTGRSVHPVNPRAGTIEGLPTYASLNQLPEPVHGISVVTPPQVSLQVIDEAHGMGIQHIWLQPGAEDEAVISRARELGFPLIHSGPCILVTLRYHD